MGHYSMDEKKQPTYRKIDSVVVQLFFPEITETPLEGTLEAKIIDTKKIQQRKNEREFLIGFDSVMDKYGPLLKNQKNKEKMNYKNIWEDIPRELELKAKIIYSQRVKKYFGAIVKSEWVEEKKEVNPTTLKEIAELRINQKLKEINFISLEPETQIGVGQYAALIDLSLKALQDPKITSKEGRFLAKNLHMSLYITREKISQDIHDKFKNILFYKTERNFLNCPDNVGKEIHIAFKEVWRRYHLGVTRETSYRNSKDVEKELVRRRLERMERETPETEIAFPESG